MDLGLTGALGFTKPRLRLICGYPASSAIRVHTFLRSFDQVAGHHHGQATSASVSVLQLSPEKIPCKSCVCLYMKFLQKRAAKLKLIMMLSLVHDDSLQVARLGCTPF